MVKQTLLLTLINLHLVREPIGKCLWRHRHSVPISNAVVFNTFSYLAVWKNDICKNANVPPVLKPTKGRRLTPHIQDETGDDSFLIPVFESCTCLHQLSRDVPPPHPPLLFLGVLVYIFLSMVLVLCFLLLVGAMSLYREQLLHCFSCKGRSQDTEF